ncbi:hypothetical protein ACFPOU_17110 [Massilia jejuensis]|uniref:Uncharacterized protein n=1 Tax=Massilia jejuensis TaxID=648894 RepID=A0ABW0PJE9_9BURK
MTHASTRTIAHRDLGVGENQASLHAIMTAPPMSAAAHAAAARQRTASRRQAEDARQLRALTSDDWRAA